MPTSYIQEQARKSAQEERTGRSTRTRKQVQQLWASRGAKRRKKPEKPPQTRHHKTQPTTELSD